MSRLVLTACLAILLVPVAAEAKLGAGDKAPALHVSAWVKGAAVDPLKGGPNDIYVIEFWATWCGPCKMSIPHLTEVQKHFDKKVTIVGVTDEDDDVVKPFVQSWGGRMDYRVAVDDDQKTTRAYLMAAGVNGIPHAFIVKGGRIAWHGHPMEMDDVLVKMTGDKAWGKIVEQRKAQEERLEKIQERIDAAARNNKWDDVLGGLDELAKLSPDDDRRSAITIQKYIVVAVHKKDKAEAAKLGGTFVSSVENPQVLNDFAWGILADPSMKGHRDLKLALQAAEKASRLSNGSDAAILDTLARAKYDSGSKDEAIKIQKKAIALCKNAGMKKDMKESLARYQSGEESESD